MSRLTNIAAPIIVLAASAAAYALLQATKPVPEKSSEPPRPISVYTAPVVQEAVRLRVVTQGEVRARTQVDIISQVGGRVVSVSPEFTEGGRVLPDVPLLTIEDIDYRLALGQAQARVAESEVRLKQALADADVARKQLRNDPTASDLALKKPQVAEAQARLKGSEADLERAQLDLERTGVSLPFRGRLMETRVDIGQYLAPGSLLGRAFGTDVVEIRLPLDNAQLAALGLPIGYTAAPGNGLPVALSARVAGQDQHWRGSLIRLDASVDPDTRMLYGIAEVRDPYDSGASASGMPLAVGLYVEAEIQGREITDAQTIPRAALRAGDRVFLINERNRLEVRQVRIAHSNAEQVVVQQGLTAGEQVIVSPLRNPIQGMSVAPLPNSSSGEQ